MIRLLGFYFIGFPIIISALIGYLYLLGMGAIFAHDEMGVPLWIVLIVTGYFFFGPIVKFLNFAKDYPKPAVQSLSPGYIASKNAAELERIRNL